MEPFIGEIKLLSFDFVPKGWVVCAGQTMAISANQALFSLIGVTYGGNGTTTFQLPDLRGAAAIAQGAAPGLTSYPIGAVAGSQGVALTQTEVPPHNHQVAVDSVLATNTIPTGNFMAASNATIGNVYGATPNAQMATSPLNNGGGGQPHENQSPYLAMTYGIALVGIYPSRP